MQQNNAGFLRRFIAYYIDLLIYLVLFTVPFYLMLKEAVNKVNTFVPKPYVGQDTTDILELVANFAPFINIFVFACVFFLLGAIAWLFYQVYFVSHFGGTIGKLVCGLRIKDSRTDANLDSKTAFYRSYPGYMFSSAFFGLGYLRIIKNDQNLAWHDELFNTKVVKEGSILPGVISFVLLAVILGSLIGVIFTILTQIF